MHAHGDDFVVVDRRGQDEPITPDVARKLGNRNTGIGVNQLAVILDCDEDNRYGKDDYLTITFEP